MKFFILYIYIISKYILIIGIRLVLFICTLGYIGDIIAVMHVIQVSKKIIFQNWFVQF